MKVLVFQHTACETLGVIEGIFKEKDISFEYVRPFEGQPVPQKLNTTSGIVLLGGPMSVYDQKRYPFLIEEMHLIERVIAQGRPVLGICLGSQLLAAVLGATVTKAPQKEIGWHLVNLTQEATNDQLWKNIPPSFIAYHWHGDIFSLPPGAVRLASSPQTENQAFRYGTNVYGVLFHLEVTQKIIKEMVKNFADEIEQTSLKSKQILAGSSRYLDTLGRLARSVYSKWAEFILESV